MPEITPPRVQSSPVEANKTEIAPMNPAARVFRSCSVAAEQGLGNSVSQRLGEGSRDVTSQLYNGIRIQYIRPTSCDRGWKCLGGF